MVGFKPYAQHSLVSRRFDIAVYISYQLMGASIPSRKDHERLLVNLLVMPSTIGNFTLLICNSSIPGVKLVAEMTAFVCFGIVCDAKSLQLFGQFGYFTTTLYIVWRFLLILLSTHYCPWLTVDTVV